MLKASLDELKRKLTESASLVESMIDKSITGLIQKDEKLLLEVIEQDEPRENDLEIDIDEACIHVVACYQPQAKGLRTIMMVLKMNNDFERMADEAVNICESALFLIKRDSLASFMKEDTTLARSVCERDDLVDGLRDQILRELTTFMASDPETIERSIHLIRISRSLERIADLSTNICEDVIYMAEGKTIKHQRWEERK
jgi:phosphate transport system protein